MTENSDHSFWERMLVGTGNSPRAQREEKVLKYVIHRINKDADLHGVLQEPYVRRNCSEAEIDEIRSNPGLIHAAREHLEHAFRSGELDPKRRQ
jgi:hypothetical protein